MTDRAEERVVNKRELASDVSLELLTVPANQRCEKTADREREASRRDEAETRHEDHGMVGRRAAAIY